MDRSIELMFYLLAFAVDHHHEYCDPVEDFLPVPLKVRWTLFKNFTLFIFSFFSKTFLQRLSVGNMEKGVEAEKSPLNAHHHRVTDRLLGGHCHVGRRKRTWSILICNEIYYALRTGDQSTWVYQWSCCGSFREDSVCYSFPGPRILEGKNLPAVFFHSYSTRWYSSKKLSTRFFSFFVISFSLSLLGITQKWINFIDVILVLNKKILKNLLYNLHMTFLHLTTFLLVVFFSFLWTSDIGVVRVVSWKLFYMLVTFHYSFYFGTVHILHSASPFCTCSGRFSRAARLILLLEIALLLASSPCICSVCVCVWSGAKLNLQEIFTCPQHHSRSIDNVYITIKSIMPK